MVASAALYFFDTNALAKRYLWDQGSAWVAWALARRTPTPVLMFSELARVELASALYKLERMHGTHPSFTDSVVAQFERDVQRSESAAQRPAQVLLPLSVGVLERARTVLAVYRSGTPNALRSLDALQLATALLIYEALPPERRDDFRFVTSDKQLLGAANHAGLITVRPEDQVVPTP